MNRLSKILVSVLLCALMVLAFQWRSPGISLARSGYFMHGNECQESVGPVASEIAQGRHVDGDEEKKAETNTEEKKTPPTVDDSNQAANKTNPAAKEPKTEDKHDQQAQADEEKQKQRQEQKEKEQQEAASMNAALKSLRRDLCKMWKLHYNIAPGSDLPEDLPSDVQSQWASLGCNSFFRVPSSVFGGPATCENIFSQDVDAAVVREKQATWIAFLTPIMSNAGKAQDASLKGIDSLLFWRYLWKTFLDYSAHNLKPDSKSYYYTFYFGIDQGDEGLDQTEIIEQIWARMQNDMKTRGLDTSKVGLRAFVASDTAHAPSWMVSHLAQEAFCADVDYFYQINDDVSMQSRDWEAKLTSTLQDHNNIGATGPLDLYNNRIFTQSFTHRNHMSIFHPLYFPLAFRNWYSDDWLTGVYRGIQAVFRQTSVVVHHEHKAVGERYKVHPAEKQLRAELSKGAARINEWMAEQDKLRKEGLSVWQIRQQDRQAKCPA